MFKSTIDTIIYFEVCLARPVNFFGLLVYAFACIVIFVKKIYKSRRGGHKTKIVHFVDQLNYLPLKHDLESD